jgi:hypothetical protein
MGLQSSANNAGQSDTIDWDTLNHEMASRGTSLGVNRHDAYRAFAKRWEQEPELKNYVKRFDGDGAVLKTGKGEPMPNQGEPKKSMKAGAAMAATKRTDKA